MTDKSNDSAAPIEFIVLTPHGKAVDIRCDSVHLVLCDDETGHGGGQVGLRRGHLPAVLALGDGETVVHTVLHGGFASVRDNVIRVITDSDIENDKERDIGKED